MSTKIQKVSELYSIDSLQVNIPTRVIKSHSEYIRDTYVEVNTRTGEVSKKPAKTIRHWSKCSRMSFGLSQKKVSKIHEECISVTIPSKILKENYFDGFNSDNAHRVYDAVISTGFVDISQDAFFNATSVTDADSKVDIYANSVSIVSVNSQLKKEARLNAELNKGCKPFDSQGIQFSTRGGASLANPFTKVYDKSKQLLSVEPSLIRTYLSGVDYKNIIRSEVTLKNKDYFQRILKTSNTSFLSVVSMSQQQHKKVHNYLWSKQLTDCVLNKKPVISKGLTGMRLDCYRYMVEYLEQGGDIVAFLKKSKLDRTKQDWYNMKIMYTELYTMYQRNLANEKYDSDSVYNPEIFTIIQKVRAA